MSVCSSEPYNWIKLPINNIPISIIFKFLRLKEDSICGHKLSFCIFQYTSTATCLALPLLTEVKTQTHPPHSFLKRWKPGVHQSPPMTDQLKIVGLWSPQVPRTLLLIPLAASHLLTTRSHHGWTTGTAKDTSKPPNH